MNKKTLFLFLLIIVYHVAYSQISPSEGNKINFRLIGFSFPAMKKVNNYTVEIASGNYNSEDSFKNNIASTLKSETNRITGEVPFWGSDYTWRVAYTGNDSKITKSALHHFSTIFPHSLDTGKFRFLITTKAKQFKDAFVFLDAGRALYDMEGNAVWYLPNVEGITNERTSVRDLKMSPQGTITFLVGSRTNNTAYEMDYNGKILWQAPNNGKISGDTIEHYHHELTKLKNGNYMILASDFVPLQWRIFSPKDSGLFIASSDSTKPTIRTTNYEKSPFGTVIEYDSKGKIVWSWKSSDYFKGKDLQNHITLEMRKDTVDDHENAFFFDEKNSIIYLSFKNTSVLFKLKYPGGELINSYGNTSWTDARPGSSPVFCGQHGCKLSDDGKLYMYNNYECNIDSVPELLVLQEPDSKNGSLKKLWEYKYPLSDIEKQKKKNLSSGGNIIELPGHAMFASMGTPYSGVFIVSEDKKLLWDGHYERYMKRENRWKEISTYRASIIENRKDLEKLIWNGEQDK